MPFLSRHDIRTWVGMPNARWAESQRAGGALKLIHEPYDGQVAWDWVATELFSTLFSKDGGYVVDTKRNALWHKRGQVSTSYSCQKEKKVKPYLTLYSHLYEKHPVPEHILANVVSQWMILYKKQW